MPDKRCTLDDVVAELRDGMTVGIGGWGSRRKPMAIVRAILRSPVRDLTLVALRRPRRGPALPGGQGAPGRLGLRVARLHTARAALPCRPPVGRGGGDRDRRGDDAARPAGGSVAGAVPTDRVGLGSDLLRLNPELRTVRSPYADGEELVAVPALELDVALVHMNRGDAGGTGSSSASTRTSTTCSAWRRSGGSCRSSGSSTPMTS